jgi:hypothetical protein
MRRQYRLGITKINIYEISPSQPNFFVNSCVLLPWSPNFFCNFGYPCPLWVWVMVKSVVIGFSIRLPPWVMLTPSLSRNAPGISSLTISLAASGNALALWSNSGGACVSICCSLAQGFGFYGALMLALGVPY